MTSYRVRWSGYHPSWEQWRAPGFTLVLLYTKIAKLQEGTRPRRMPSA